MNPKKSTSLSSGGRPHLPLISRDDNPTPFAPTFAVACGTETQRPSTTLITAPSGMRDRLDAHRGVASPGIAG